MDKDSSVCVYTASNMDWHAISVNHVNHIVSEIIKKIQTKDGTNEVISLTDTRLSEYSNMHVCFNYDRKPYIIGDMGMKINKNRVSLLQLSTGIIESRSMNKLDISNTMSIDLSTAWISELRHTILYDNLDKITNILENTSYSKYMRRNDTWVESTL
ncbi:hypothetical protein TI39_contig1052g00004 [Zymoseptoria brevis]|uniref:Uncharacterized protein n=1 Tax=Zymoseptoria brevis TaxID=1047168 RepID=A0A0F4GEA9_9PEZI|nr:hypothetical protein TI39_contig1052g00004 [Zymoseptoria brevis]